MFKTQVDCFLLQNVAIRRTTDAHDAVVMLVVLVLVQEHIMDGKYVMGAIVQ